LIQIKIIIFKKINNNYFLTETNKENLSFVLEISKKLNLKNNLLLKTIQNFKGLNIVNKLF
jgi:UDP-N-acetylmuramoylalanine--D-glutamate ligase